MVTEVQHLIWTTGGTVAPFLAGISLSNRLKLVQVRQLIVGHKDVDTDGGLTEDQEHLFGKIECLEESMETQHDAVMTEIEDFRDQLNDND